LPRFSPTLGRIHFLRPPRDPLNSLLSFGYVLVGNELQSLLDGMGSRVLGDFT
jgi:hypothetical protein